MKLSRPITVLLNKTELEEDIKIQYDVDIELNKVFGPLGCKYYTVIYMPHIRAELEYGCSEKERTVYTYIDDVIPSNTEYVIIKNDEVLL